MPKFLQTPKPVKSEELISSSWTQFRFIRYILTPSLRRRKNHANHILEQKVIAILVKNARKAKPEHSRHFESMITQSKMLLKSGDKYMREQGSPVPPSRKNQIKKIKIQVITNVTVRQCSKQPKREDVSPYLVTSIRKKNYL